MKRSGGFGQDVSSYFNFSHHTTEKDYFKKSTVLLAKRKSIDVPKLKQSKTKMPPPAPKCGNDICIPVFQKQLLKMLKSPLYYYLRQLLTFFIQAEFCLLV